MAMSQDDQKLIEVCIENAIMKAMEKHREQADRNIQSAIEQHMKSCPIGHGIKIRMSFVGGMIFLASLLGGAIGTAAGKIYGIIK